MNSFVLFTPFLMNDGTISSLRIKAVLLLTTARVFCRNYRTSNPLSFHLFICSSVQYCEQVVLSSQLPMLVTSFTASVTGPHCNVIWVGLNFIIEILPPSFPPVVVFCRKLHSSISSFMTLLFLTDLSISCIDQLINCFNFQAFEGTLEAKVSSESAFLL